MVDVTSDRAGGTAEQFGLVTAHVTDAVVVADTALSTVYTANPACESVFGESPERLSESPQALVAALHPDDRDAFEAAVERLASDDGDDSHERRFRLADGGRVRVTLATTGDGSGDGTGDESGDRLVVVASAAGVTDSGEWGAADVFDTVGDGLVVHDAETGEIVDVNRAFCEMNGYTREELVGERIDLVTAVEEGYAYEEANRLIRRAREAGTQRFEWRNRRKDGTTFPVEVTLELVEADGAEHVLASVRDITERKDHERLVRALHESTECLQTAETREAVCAAAVDAAERVLDLSMSSCWLHDDGDARLEPVATTDAVREAPGGPGVYGPGTVEYDCYDSEEMAVYDPSDHWERAPVTRAVLLPLSGHGLLAVGDPSVEAFDEVLVDAARTLARHTTTALDRVERTEQRRESERRMSAIFDRIDEAIFLTDKVALDSDAEGSVYLGAGYEAVFGRSYDYIAADDTETFVDLVHPEDREAYREHLRAQAADIRAGDPDDRYAHEYRIEHPTDGVRWIHSDFYPTEWDDGDYRLVVVSRDVTARKERRDTLETFHEATRELTEAGSRPEASQRAVEAAARVLELPLVSVSLYDDEAGTLRPVSATDTLADSVDELPSFEPGDSLPWQVFVDGEAVHLADDASDHDVYGEGVTDPDVVLPLGSHGVMLVGAPAETFDAERVELAQILAATLEAALNHVQGQRELERREAELQRHRERAERLERLNTVIREIEQATVEETDRDAIETAVCERLTTVGTYRVAWIAEPSPAGDALVARTVSGDDAGYVDTLAVGRSGEGIDSHPAAEAYAAQEVRTVQNLATNGAAGAWRKPALREGYQSISSVPLLYDGTVYGVLTLVADDPNAFDDRTAAILGELGRSVGYALSVLERRDALESDTTTELEFAVDDERLPFVRLAERLDADVRLERTVRRTGGSFGTFYTVDGADPEAALDAVESVPAVEDATLVSADPEAAAGLVEAVTPSWFGSVFATDGAVVRTARAGAEGGRLVVEAPQAADVRALVERFRERYPETELRAQRTHERTVQTLLELQDRLGERLTQRQLEALETAYSAGYFEWPRESSGEDVAELLGVTQPTFNKHLRTAERKAFSMLLNREYLDADTDAGPDAE